MMPVSRPNFRPSDSPVTTSLVTLDARPRGLFRRQWWRFQNWRFRRALRGKSITVIHTDGTEETRRIVDFTASTITVDEAWTKPPAGSTVYIAEHPDVR